MSLSIFRGAPRTNQVERVAGLGELGLVQSARPRALGPDLVRAAAAILVVYLHACVAYLIHPMPGLVWAIQDTPSNSVSILFWLIEIFVMPLFLLLAGFFAYRSWSSGGDLALIRSRARRLLIPMFFAVAVVLPLDYYVWLVSWVAEGTMPATQLWTQKFPRPLREHLFGFGHLWFLQYVFLYCVTLVGLGAIKRSMSPENSQPVAISIRRTSALVIGLIVTAMAVLAIAPEVVFGFQHAFYPVPTKWLYCATFFFGGAVIARADPLMTWLTEIAPRMLAGGAVCAAATVAIGQWSIERADSSSLAMDIGIASRMTLASLTVAAAWAISLGLIGMANRLSPALANQPALGRTISYMAAAGFWVYLVHHPLVALIQLDLKWVVPELSPLVKSVITAVVATGVSLGTYEILIRNKPLGRWIGIESSNKHAVCERRGLTLAEQPDDQDMGGDLGEESTRIVTQPIRRAA